jgi:hypothetical protein
MAEDMPCGHYLRRRREDSYAKTYPTQSSAVAIEWLNYIEETKGLTISHARNGAEFKVGPKNIPVDGFCR